MTVPQKLIENRNILEGNFISSLYNNIELYEEYEKEIILDDFLLEDTRFYYSLGLDLYKKGVTVIDDTTIQLNINGSEEIKKGYINRGGWATIAEIKKITKKENSDHYYNELVKWNLIIKLHERGFDVLSSLDKFVKMSSDDIIDYYEFHLNSVGLGKSREIIVEDLGIDDEFINCLDDGFEMGLNFAKHCPLLNYITCGVPVSDMMLIGGYSGTGKSSFIFANMVIPLIESGNKIVFISNEQKIAVFQIMLISMVLAEKFNYYGLTRKKLKTGKFTQEQREAINKAKNYINEHIKPNLKFVKLFDYDTKKIIKTIKKYSKIGYNMYCYDTLKSDDLSDAHAWGKIIESSKQLLQVVSKEEVSFVATYQLAPATYGRRLLTVDTLSNCKQLKEVFSEMVYFRPIFDDEFTGKDKDIKCYTLEKQGGKHVEKPVVLDERKKYLIARIDKTRNDETGITIVYEFNGRYNIWKEVGFCRVSQDFGQRS